MLTQPPAGLVATREALRALACYVIAPARKARTGRIGLRPTGEGFGTPRFDDGGRIVVRGDRLIVEGGAAVEAETTITTVRNAAALVGVELSPDPGVGHDLPPYEPDADLDVDDAASRWLGDWYAFGAAELDRLRADRPRITVGEAQLWPEHFDLAVTVELDGGATVNVGFSPGDRDTDEPYVYVGPHDRAGLEGGYWNAPFGAALMLAGLQQAGDPARQAAEFVADGLRRVAARGSEA